MCGIAGSAGPLTREARDAVRRANAAQALRGPDGEGYWESHDEEGPNGVAFAHRRLAIIDLSERGRQPMVDAATGNVITFNGEVFNFAEIRAELEAAGAELTSRTDTEVILKAYGMWGVGCLERLRGMFAFAIRDAATGRVLLVRDRLGVKPLYYAAGPARDGGRRTLYFASQVRALLAAGITTRRLSPLAVSSYLWHGFVADDQSILEGVLRLPAGCFTWVEADGRIGAPERYWRLPPDRRRTSDASELVAELERSVALRLVSDVPLGVFLSGGIDSSAVAALASRAREEPIETFNVCFDEAEFDESSWARRVAAAIGARHHEIRLTQSTFESGLDVALSALDQPTFDGINTYVVSRAVRDAGITVALSGAGGDELFGGYRSFEELTRVRRISALASPVPTPLSRGAAALFTRFKSGAPGEVGPQTRWGKLGDALSTRGSLRDAYQVSYGLFTTDFLDELTLPGVRGRTRFGLGARRADAMARLVEGADPLHAITQLELSSFVGDRLLPDTDCASMAASLEVRVPLLDHRVVEEAARLDPDVRYHPLGKKMALRRAALGRLDPSLFDRPKAGFVLPIEPWSRGALEDRITDAFDDRRRCASVGLESDSVGKLWRAYRAGAPGMYWSRVWSLYALLDWASRNEATL
jgi:asparagine synthase (glutamine-hydrolysing)